MKRNLLMFFLIFTFSFFLMSIRSSAKQLCTYSITENDQDFINYFRQNIYNSKDYKEWFDKGKYVLISSGSNDNYWSIFLSSKYICVNEDGANYFQKGSFVAQAMMKRNSFNNFYFHITFDDKSSLAGSASRYFGSDLIYSNYDIPTFSCNSNGTYSVNSDKIFFQRPSLSMAEAVQEIPKKMRIQARQVIPMAVFCLALLISLNVLSRKLYPFLH